MKNTLSLNGSWQLNEYNGNAEAIIAQVPGEVHADLQRAGKIADPYFAMNAEDVKWVDEKRWLYKRTFDVDDEFIQKKTYLEFDGLDTTAAIFLNGVEVGKTSNMFIPHRYDVSEVVEIGRNTIEVLFDPASPDSRTMRLLEHPNLAGVGIWRDVRLVSYDLVSINNVHIETEIEGAWANAWIYIEVENHTREDLQVVTSVVVSKGENHEKIEVDDWVSPFGGVIEAVIRIEEPELWWPNGVGEPSLYDCMVGLTCEGDVQDVTQASFGVRNIELSGTNLQINGEKALYKAAKWMPVDLLFPNASDKQCRNLLQQVHDANINLLRVSGCGVYESAAFYQACDDLGIMIWQDFMIGDQLSEEIECVIKELRNHPSIVVWDAAGNDRIPAVLKKFDRTRPLVDGDSFFGSVYEVIGTPQIESLLKFVSESDLSPNNKVLRYHGCPEDMSENTSPEQFTAASGIRQGEMLKAEIESRRRMGSGIMLGAFNDSWPAISASLVDYYSRPKAAYYYAMRAFESVIVSFEKIDGRVRVHVINDDRIQVMDGILQVGLMTFDACGFDPQEIPVKLEPGSSAILWESKPLESIFTDKKKQCLVALLIDREETVAKNVFFPSSADEMDFPQPKLLVHRDQLTESTHELVVSADSYARNITISNIPAHCRPSDNFFDIIPGEQKTVTIRNISVEEANGLKLNVWRA